MKAYKYLMMASVAILSLSSCSDELTMLSGEGSVILNASISSDVKFAGSRADEAHQAALREELSESFKLWISNDKGVISQYSGFDNLPTTSIPMLSGKYVAEAWAGDSVSASWDKRWYKACVPFEISKGETTQVEIPCKIANTVVTVQYSADVDDILKDYTLDVGHKRGHLSFDESVRNADGTYPSAYFMMPSSDKNLTWTLTGTKKIDGTTIYTRTNKIIDVKPGYEYIFKISCGTGDVEEIGGGFLNIVVENRPIKKTEDIIVSVAPTIKGSPSDEDVIHCQPEMLNDFYYNAYITACNDIQSVIITCDKFADVFGDADAKDFEAIGLGSEATTTLANAGVLLNYQYDAANDAAGMKVSFRNEFFRTYCSQEGEYKITFYVTDKENLIASRTVTINISSNPIDVAAPSASVADGLTFTSAVLEGDILSPDKLDGDVTVFYREADASRSDDWLSAKASILRDGARTYYSVVLSDLKPLTKYEYYASAPIVGKEPFVTSVATFSTPDGPQLPNAGFEEWQTSSTPYLIYPAGGTLFWDSGNHGSATMKKNVTVPDSEIKHSGNYSICLNSQFVGIGKLGKFAAGNVFIGQYLGTDGTDGILGFGQPFTHRPKAIKGYVKYSPVAISDVASDAPAEYVKGELDKGIIYTALLDGTTKEYDGNAFPVIIKTKTKELFDKNASNVIAYGEIIFSEATEGSNMIEFTIPLTYKSDATPSYIMLTASASKGGDYFTGGSGSKMWLDDIKLVY